MRLQFCLILLTFNDCFGDKSDDNRNRILKLHGLTGLVSGIKATTPTSTSVTSFTSTTSALSSIADFHKPSFWSLFSLKPNYLGSHGSSGSGLIGSGSTGSGSTGTGSSSSALINFLSSILSSKPSLFTPSPSFSSSSGSYSPFNPLVGSKPAQVVSNLKMLLNPYNWIQPILQSSGNLKSSLFNFTIPITTSIPTSTPASKPIFTHISKPDLHLNHDLTSTHQPLTIFDTWIPHILAGGTAIGLAIGLPFLAHSNYYKDDEPQATFAIRPLPFEANTKRNLPYYYNAHDQYQHTLQQPYNVNNYIMRKKRKNR